MRGYERSITRFVRSRFGAVAMSVVALVSMWAAWVADAFVPLPTGYGIVTRGALIDLGGNVLSLVSGMALALTVSAVMVVLNRTFNILRTTAILFSGMYMVMEAAIPTVGSQLVGGILLNIAMLAAIALMYTTYHSPQNTPRVFLAFCIVSAGSLCQYYFVPCIAALLFVMGQMRCLSVRTLLAAVIGVVTPYWIALGFGLVSFHDFHLPDTPGMMQGIGPQAALPFMATVGFTLVSGLVLTILNLVKVYSYNARSRSINGVITVMTIITQVLCVTDAANIIAYIPMLNCCTAFQAGLYFRINTERRGYLPVVVMLVAYSALYVWNLWVLI